MTDRKKIFFNNFLGGIAWGLGATVGVSILVALFGFLLRQVDVVPVLGTFVSDITAFVLENLQRNPELVQ